MSDLLGTTRHKMMKVLEEAFRNQRHNIFTKAGELYTSLFSGLKDAAEVGEILPSFNQDQIFSILLNRVICDYHLGRFSESLYFLDLCIRYVPSHPTPYVFSVIFSLVLDHGEKAISNAKVAIKKFPEFRHDFLLVLSITHQYMSNYDESLKCCEEVLEKDSNNVFALILKGDSLKFHPTKIVVEEHLECYRTALKLDPVCAPQYIGKGYLPKKGQEKKKTVQHIRNTCRRYLFTLVLDIFKPPPMIHSPRVDRISAFIKFAKLFGIDLQPTLEISPIKKKKTVIIPNTPSHGKENEPSIHIVFEDAASSEVIHKDSSRKKRRGSRKKRKRKARKSANVSRQLQFGKYTVRDHRPYRKHWKESRKNISPKKRTTVLIGSKKKKNTNPSRNYSRPWLLSSQKQQRKNKISPTTTKISNQNNNKKKKTKKLKRKKKSNNNNPPPTNKVVTIKASYDTSRNRGNYDKPWLDDAYVSIKKRIKKSKGDIGGGGGGGGEDPNKFNNKRRDNRSKSAGPSMRKRSGLLRFDDSTGDFILSSTLDEDDLIEIKRKKHDESIVDHNHKMYKRRRRESEERLNRFNNNSNKYGMVKWDYPGSAVYDRHQHRSGEFWTVDPKMKMYRSMFGFSDLGRTGNIVNTFFKTVPQRIHVV